MSRLEPRRRFAGGGDIYQVDDMESPAVDMTVGTPTGALPTMSQVGKAQGMAPPKPERQFNLFPNVTKPWQRALLTGGMGAAMSSGAGALGALGGGLGAAGLGLLLNRKKKAAAADASADTSTDIAEPNLARPAGSDIETRRRGGAIGRRPHMAATAKAPRARRFQMGGINSPLPPAAAGAAPPVNPAAAAALQQAIAQGAGMGVPGQPAPGAAAPVTGAPPPPPTVGATPSAMPGLGLAGASAPSVAAPPTSVGAPAATSLQNLNAALRRRPYAKGGKVADGPVNDGSETDAKKARPDRQWGNTGRGASNEPEVEKKAKGGKILHKRPKGPKIAIAISTKKPVSTPNPYDYEDSEGTAPPVGTPTPPSGSPPPGPPPAMKKGGKWIEDMHLKKGALHKQMGIPQDKKIPEKKLDAAAEKGGKLGKRARVAEQLRGFRKNKGGACEKMAAGGAAKERKGFPNTQKPPAKRFARGGTVRGCGAAKKGCSFSGIY